MDETVGGDELLDYLEKEGNIAATVRFLLGKDKVEEDE